MKHRSRKLLASLTVAALLSVGAGWSGAALASEPFLGQIQYFGFNFNPRGWALCNGQLLDIAQNSALFSLLGTTYGGDGRTTFQLPDMRGRVPLHFGQGAGLTNRVIGSRGGAEQVVLNTTQIPAHNHALGTNATATLRADSGDASTNVPAGNALADTKREDVYSGVAPSVDMRSGSVVLGGTTDNTGGTQSHENMPPFLTVNCSIALVGLFPSRN